MKEEFIPDFDVSTTSTVAYPSSQLQAEDVSFSEKTCLQESEEQEGKGEKEIPQSAHTIHREKIFAVLQANFKPQVIPWKRFSNYNKLSRVLHTFCTYCKVILCSDKLLFTPWRILCRRETNFHSFSEGIVRRRTQTPTEESKSFEM